MAYKKVALEVKVNALKEAIELKDIETIAKKYGISRETLRSDYDKLVGEIATIIKDKT
jgi:DNA-binding GntR family transcriptional regulator